MSETNNPYASPMAEDSILSGNADYMQHGRLASRGRRLAAVIIDGILLSIVGLPLQYLFRYGSFDQTPISPSEINFLNPISVYAAMGWRDVLLSFFVPIAVYLGLNGALLYSNGQTIGKRLLSIKIVRKDGSKAEFSRLIFHRWLLLSLIYMIPVVNYVFMLLDPLMIFRSSRYCLHDDIADTAVVEA